jgi:hypothetical protein
MKLRRNKKNTKLLAKKLEERGLFGDLAVDGTIISLKIICKVF